MAKGMLVLIGAAVFVAAWRVPVAARAHADDYTAQLTGKDELPPNSSKATGAVSITVAGNELHYQISVQGLSGPAQAAHIHVGAGAPILPFTIKHATDGQIANDSVDISNGATMGANTLPGDSLKALLANGQAYVNVHTAKYPKGEVRGQLTSH